MSAPPNSSGCWALVVAHNEALTIRDVVEGAIRAVDQVLVIDDGSTDGTLETLDGLNVLRIRHESNLGKGLRLASGLDTAFERGAREVVALDADLQHDPTDVPRLREASKNNVGALVLGDRSADMHKAPKSRASAIRFGNFFIGWACGREIADAQCGMRLYPRSLWERTRVPDSDRAHFIYETSVLMHAAEAGIPFATVPIAARYEGFEQRPSHFRPVADFFRITRCVTAFLVRKQLKRLTGASRAHLNSDLGTRKKRESQ